MADATMQQLTQVLQQLLANQQQNPAPIAPPLPSLPNIECFELSEQRGRKIEDWLDRFNFAVDCSAPNLSDELKVKLLMTKLGEDAYAEYSKSCLPKKVTEFNFAQTMEQLNGLFGKPQSVWIDRYECLRARKQDDEDFGTFWEQHVEEKPVEPIATQLLAMRQRTFLQAVPSHQNVNQKHRLIEIPIEMNGKKVDFVIDSGTESTVLCEEAHRRIGSPRNLLGSEMMEELGLLEPIRRSVAGKLPAENVQGAKEQHHQSAVREGVSKMPSDKHQRKTKRVAVGATGVASRSNSQSWRAGYVDNRAGIRQDGVSLRKAPSEIIAGGKAEGGHGQRERLESDRPPLLVSDLNPLA
uniref:Peptidase A2 domain-containing protein n=1 Tax=Globodera pallida TaxID=36090 RepID=A0A183C870_GLOPA